MRRGGRQGKWKEVVGHSSFVPPTTYESFQHDSVAPTCSGHPSPTSQLPSSRSSGSQSQVPNTAGSLGSEVPRLIIRPRTYNKFNHQLLCNQRIGDLIEMRFEGAWKSWKKFPKANRDLIFSEFATAKQGRAPTIAEAFMHLRSKVDSEGNVKWVNDRAKKTHDEFTTKLSQASSQSSNGDDIISNEQQMEIFADVVGGAKKGIIYGLAGQDYSVTLGSSSSSHGRMASAWQNERTQMQEQLNALKSSIDEMQTSFHSRVDVAVHQRMEAQFQQRVESEVQHRVEAERQRLDAEMNERIEAERQRLDAEMDERIEAKILARFASFNSRLPRSPPSNDQ